MDPRNKDPSLSQVLQQPFKFQTQLHQNPVLDQQPCYGYDRAAHSGVLNKPQHNYNQHQRQYISQQNNNYPSSNNQHLLQQQRQNQAKPPHKQQQKPPHQQHHYQNQYQQQRKEQQYQNGSQPKENDSELVPGKPVVHPIRHDFWARRTAQRASEALRAANNMALPPVVTTNTLPATNSAYPTQNQLIQNSSYQQRSSGSISAQTTSSFVGGSPVTSGSSLRVAMPPSGTRSTSPSVGGVGGCRSSEERSERRRVRKRRVASDGETGGRRSGGSRNGGGAGGTGSGNEGRSGRTSSRSNPRRGGGHAREQEKDIRNSLPTNFRATISESSPPLPAALLRKLEIKEVNGLGKIRVVLRVSPLVRLLEGEAAVLLLDKKRRQVTLTDPLAPPLKHSSIGVAAPKMFAFDQVYSQDDSQSDVVTGSVVDILHAVLTGNDGCILCFGGALLGKSYTMVGLHGSQDQLGVIPSCIAWLYKSIAEQKAKTGARFSVRVSALAVDATGANVKDLLGQYSQEGEQPSSSLLSEGAAGVGVLASLSELRAPSPETAAHYLDAALAGRSSLALSSVLQRQQQQQQQQKQNSPIFPGSATLVYTLHVYQYAVDKNGKGGVVGGRSRLHLLDMGDMSARHGSASMSLSSLTSVLLAIFNGQKYLPHRDNQLTGVLREALNSLTCHTALVVHVSPAARHAQHTLTTLQLAARVHRTRRKKIRGMHSGSSSGSSGSRRSSGGETSAGSSSLDFSSSDQSCDTVIYIGGGGPGDSTDGEHPPIFMPHHIRQPRASGLQRLRSLEQLRAQSASPTPHMRRTASASPTPTSRSVPNGKPFQKRKPCPPPRTVSNSALNANNNNSPRTTPLQAGFIRHQPGVSQINYPNNNVQLNSQPLLSTFKPFANQSFSRQNNNNNNIQHGSYEDNLNNMMNGNQISFANFGSTDKLHNYSAYQEPNNLVPTALSPNQNATNVQNMRFFQLTQQQLHQQQLFQQHSLQEQQRIFEQQKLMQPDQQQPEAPKVIRQQPLSSVFRQPQPDTRLQKLDATSDEQWIDGPRVHKSRVPAARCVSNKNEHDETWVDGPQVSTQSNGTQVSAATSSGQPGSYGFMDDHKKNMIEKWVEVQTAQVVNQISVKSNDKDCKALVNSSSNNNLATTKSAIDDVNNDIVEEEPVALTHLTQFRTCDESTNGSDVDTLSEDPSASGPQATEQPSLIEELERKNLIPSGFDIILENQKDELSLEHILISSADETKIASDCSTKGRGSPETTSLGGELSIDEVCSQCEALAEECEELSSLLSCEEDECKRQIHQGLATVLEEPELESAVAAEDAAQLRDGIESNGVENDDDDAATSKMDTLRSSRAGDDGNEADEESSEFGDSSRKTLEDSSPITGRFSGAARKPSGNVSLSGVNYKRRVSNSGEESSLFAESRQAPEKASLSGVNFRRRTGAASTEESLSEISYGRRCVKRTSTSSSTSDRDFFPRREMSSDRFPGQSLSTRSPPEMIDVDLPAYPVVSVDCSTQVCEDDLLSGGQSSCPDGSNSSSGDDHPLRVLSEENLTCASTFTDSYSQMGETGDEDDSEDEANRPFSLFEAINYDKLSTQDSCKLIDIDRMGALYKTLANHGNGHMNLQPSTLGEILSNSRDSLLGAVTTNDASKNFLSESVSKGNTKSELDYESICGENNDDVSINNSLSTVGQETSCNVCNKVRMPLGESLTRGISHIYQNGLQVQWLSNGTDLPDDKCCCDIQTELPPPYIPSSMYAFPTLKEYEKSSHSSLVKNRSETSVNLSDYNTLETKDANNSVDVTSNDRVPSNGVSVPDFIEDSEANVVLCNPVKYNYSLDKSTSDLNDERAVSDDDSNVSEDSEYMIRTSKLSKFLCVGVGRTKSKTPYKISKQNFKNESKKNTKMKESKVKFQSKSRDSSKSPEFNSKNLLKSPSRAPSQNMSKSSSSGSSTSTGSSWRSDATSGGGLKGGRWSSSKTHSSSSGGCPTYGTNSFTYQTAPVEGYDSGHDSGVTTQRSSTPQDPSDSWNMPLVDKKSTAKGGDSQRLKMQSGVASKSGTNNSLGATPSLGESSGYGSMARDSECSSFSSSQDSEMDEEHRKENINRCQNSTGLPSLEVQKFTEEDIQRYEGRSRAAECLQLQKEHKEQQEIAALKARQKQLKSELAEAKKNLSVPDKSWAYERKSNFT
uniref:Kinesin-like protein CG14535 n=1 Tax=Hirondellea gigas TaxID=1518452 RepID=A0A6A7FY47_9CRUS